MAGISRVLAAGSMMKYQLPRLCLVLFLAFCYFLAPWTRALAQTGGATYDPDTLISALFGFPFPDDDIFWQGAFEEETPSEPEVLRQVQILTFPGIITYRFYDSINTARESVHARIGTAFPIDDAVGVFSTPDRSNEAIYDDLVSGHARDLIGRDVIVFESDGSYSACGLELNVIVCGFSSLSWNDEPLSAAVMGVTVGLALLLDVAQLTGTDPSELNSATNAADQVGANFELDAVTAELDQYWSATFAHAGPLYRSPAVREINEPVTTPCGPFRPEEAAGYCGATETIYVSPAYLDRQEEEIGNFVSAAVLAHEWGHHVQLLLDDTSGPNKDRELQADCLIGAFMANVEERGLLDYGAFLEALLLAIDIGDETFLPEDHPGAHGSPEERVKAVTKGYWGGPIDGCGLPLLPVHTPTPSPTATPTWTPTPIPVREGPTPTPTIVPPPVTPTSTPSLTAEAQAGAELLRRLPNALPLDHATCFDTVNDGTLSFEQLLGRFSGVQDAAIRLQGWGWQASAFRQFGCDGPPDGEAGWIDITVHLFGNSLAAQEAVDYFAATRAEGGPLVLAEAPAIGDHAAALSGPAVNGKEFTIYASQGPLLVRVTGVSPSGIPFINVLTVTQSVLAAQQAQPQAVPTPPVQSPSMSASSYLAATPAVRHRNCFEVLTEGTYMYDDVADALEPTGLSQSQFDELGWRDGAYRVFTCDEPPVGRATQIDVVIHQFQDDSSAQQALPYFADTYTPGTNEMRTCDTAGLLVVCVTGRSLTGSPLSDVQFVLNQVIDGAR
jgi:uncharacterized protein